MYAMDLKRAVNTLHTKETVICDYADIYLQNDFCVPDQSKDNATAITDVSRSTIEQENNEWISPSDQIINIVDLQPPLTTKSVKGNTHGAILSIGAKILEDEEKIFFERVNKAIKDNDALWNFILQNEKNAIRKELQSFYRNEFKEKSAIMKIEISSFFQQSLSELEEHIKSEVKIEAQSLYVAIITELSNEIQKKLLKEKKKLEYSLYKQFNVENQKVNAYYELLFGHEKTRYYRLKNKLVQEKNDALRSFYNQMEAERHTSTLYVLSLERKKCRMKKLILEKIQKAEMMDQLEELKQRLNLLENLKDKTVPVPLLKQQLQEKTIKIVQLFLRFISFSLKILPEQTQFLLDFQEMVLLHINEIQKQPHSSAHTLVTDDDEVNVFQFHQSEPESFVCDKEPFTIVGDLSPTPPLLLAYGSRETIDSGVDLPHFKVQRQFVYAKCHGFDELQKVLKKRVCRCYGLNESEEETSPKVVLECKKIPHPDISNDNTVIPKIVSKYEKLEHKEIKSLSECPDECGKVVEYNIDLRLQQSYLDYTEDNFEKVKSLKYLEPAEITEKIKIEDIAFDEVPFSATDKFYTTGTQYSTENFPNICDCDVKEINASDALIKRQNVLSQLLKNTPKLSNLIISDERLDNKFKEYYF